LNTEEQPKIALILSNQKPKQSSQNLGVEFTHDCVPFEKKHLNENTDDRKKNAYNSDDEDQEGGLGGGGQKVQCQNQ